MDSNARPKARAALRLLAVGLLGLMLAGCSIGRRTSTSSSSTEGSSMGTSISLHSGSDEATLERAKQWARDGRWDDAVDLLTQLSRSAEAREEYRAAALFELGEIHSSLLSPRRNETAAAEYFRALIQRYPDSELVPRAEDALRRLEPEP
jgi:hypothetical protein